MFILLTLHYANADKCNINNNKLMYLTQCCYTVLIYLNFKQQCNNNTTVIKQQFPFIMDAFLK